MPCALLGIQLVFGSQLCRICETLSIETYPGYRSQVLISSSFSSVYTIKLLNRYHEEVLGIMFQLAFVLSPVLQ